MRRLLLFRHAKSSRPSGIEDHDRPLAERGRRASREMGRFMARRGFRPDLVRVSTSRRTKETWARAARAFDGAVPAVDDHRLYEATPETLLDTVRQTPDDVRVLMLVGHNPGLEEFGKFLIAPGEAQALSRLRAKFPTAALAVIDFDVEEWADISWETGRLESFDTPNSIS